MKTIKYTISISIILIIFSCSYINDEPIDVKPWLGRWNIKSYTDSKGVPHPWGGIYHYYNNGTFTNMAFALNRDTLESEPISLEEYKELVDKCHTGYGIYSVDDEQKILSYEYTANLKTHRINQQYKAHFEIRDDSMKLNFVDMGFELLLLRGISK